MPVMPVMFICLNASIPVLFYSASMPLFLHYFILQHFFNAFNAGNAGNAGNASMPLFLYYSIMIQCLYFATIS